MFFWNITETFRKCYIFILTLELKVYIPGMFVIVSCTVGSDRHLCHMYKLDFKLKYYISTGIITS